MLIQSKFVLGNYLNCKPKTIDLNTSPYPVLQNSTTKYEFESVGSKGIIKKGIEISPLSLPGYYNFGFGDVCSDGSIDDKSETNNGDLIKVFSTIILVMKDFIMTNPLATLYFAGSNKQRTHVYNIILKRNYVLFSEEFHITGLQSINKVTTEVEYNPEKEGEYLAFLVRKKP